MFFTTAKLQFDDDFKVKVKESVKEIKNEFDAVRQIQKLLRLGDAISLGNQTFYHRFCDP